MDTDTNMIFPCQNYILWIKNGELRVGVPSENGFLDSYDMSSIDQDFGLGILAACSTRDGAFIWYYSACQNSLLQVDLSTHLNSKSLWRTSNLETVSSIASHRDRLFVVVQNLDRLVDSICEYDNGDLVPLRINGLPISEIVEPSAAIKLMGLEHGIMIHNPINGGLWKWTPGHDIQVIASGIYFESIIGVGQPFRVWIAPNSTATTIISYSALAPTGILVRSNNIPLAGLVEFRNKLWGVDCEDTWTVLSNV